MLPALLGGESVFWASAVFLHFCTANFLNAILTSSFTQAGLLIAHDFQTACRHLAYDVGKSLLIDENLQVTHCFGSQDVLTQQHKKSLIATLLDTLYFQNSVIGLQASAMYFSGLGSTCPLCSISHPGLNVPYYFMHFSLRFQ
jgi:hypothetical protein